MFLRHLKSALKKSNRLHRWFFAAQTMNLHSLKMSLQRSKYPSKFGGFWTDRNDYEFLLKRKLANGQIKEQDVSGLNQWRKDGYIILPKAIDSKIIDQFLKELDQLPQQAPNGLLMTGGEETVFRPYDPTKVKPHESIRIVDFYFYSESGRRLLLSPSITNFLHLIFECDPILTQSLSFEYGSEQPMHQDTAFVNMNSPKGLAACWIALEDVKDGSGELIYYPGSHRWGDYLFSGYSKIWSKERDGLNQLDEFHSRLHLEARKRGVKEERFMAKKGDVLIWHADLAHGGAAIRDSKLTRRSLVGHYCPASVRPMYYYWRPEHRRLFKTELGNYMTAFYRDSK